MKLKELFACNKGQRDGVSSYCRACLTARSYESRQRLHGGSREYHLRRRYGISTVQFDDMLAAQGGLCAICASRPAEHVDHDHATGAVRALLCFTCNVCMGNVRDDASLLRAAASYLDAWNTRQRNKDPLAGWIRHAHPTSAPTALRNGTRLHLEAPGVIRLEPPRNTRHRSAVG